MGASLGLPGIFVGKDLASEYGAGTALISIGVGNLILWLVALALVAMSAGKRKNAIENIGEYLGKIGMFFVILILVFAFLDWYSLQMRYGSMAINYLFQTFLQTPFESTLRIGAGLGLLIGLFSIGGIRIITWACVISAPFFIGYAFYDLFSFSEKIPFEGSWGFSSEATVTTVLMSLPAIVFLPTIFRHSQSLTHSLLGIIVMTFLVMFLQSVSIWMNYDHYTSLTIHQPHFFAALFNFSLALIFVFLSVVASNFVNIYQATAAWETVSHRDAFPKEYAVLGLLGTALFTFMQISSPMLFIEKLLSNFIASLGMVLMAAFLIKTVIKHRPRAFEKLINNGCWFIGCVASLIAQIHSPEDAFHPLMWGIGATLLSFLIIMFIEETYFATYHMVKEKE